MDIQSIYQPISEDMAFVDQCMAECLKRSQHPLIAELNSFVLDSSSKKLRPILALLSYRCVAKDKGPLAVDHDVIKVGTAMELMHRASLVHDDVIDHAQYRHNRLSIQAKWNPETAVAFGNFVYSEAFHLIATSAYPDAVRALTLATREMCEGELIQVVERGNFEFSLDQYVEMIRLKTASLFAGSCVMGAIVAECSKAEKEALYQFGLSLGIAFQMVDDLMDIASPKESLGKNPGQDLASGELTLPLIRLFEDVDNKAQLKEDILKSTDLEVFYRIREQFLASKALSRSVKDVMGYVEQAKQALAVLPQNTYRDVLGSLIQFILVRLPDATKALL